MKQTFLFALTSLLSTIHFVQGASFCCLCDGCYGVDSSKFEFILKSDHFNEEMSCVDLDYKMTTQISSSTSTACSSEVAKWRGCCCSSGSSSGCKSLERPPTTPPQVNFPAGNFPYCDLCKNGEYPRNPYNIATIASVPGNPTCSDLYWMGRSNNIPASICYPIQNFLEGDEACGCLPKNGNPSPSPPSPAPPAFQKPKEPQRTTKDDLKIGVVGRARGVTNSANVRALEAVETDNNA